MSSTQFIADLLLRSAQRLVTLLAIALRLVDTAEDSVDNKADTVVATAVDVEVEVADRLAILAVDMDTCLVGAGATFIFPFANISR